VNEVYFYALKLLRQRDYTVSALRKKIKDKFEVVPDDVIPELIRKNFLNDRRFAENYVTRRKDRGQTAVRQHLLASGIARELADAVLAQIAWPSLREALAAKMNDLKLRTPLQQRDAVRLFRALQRLGYDEDAIREEIENLHE
jgi:SOS response regulatory protein OraA/RecX